MSVRIGKLSTKKNGIGAQSTWKIFAADVDELRLKSVDEPNLKWIGTYEQFLSEFEPLD